MATLPSRFRGLVEAEDFLLFLWAAGLSYLVGLGSYREPLDLFFEGDSLTWFGVFALAGVLFVAVTESRGGPPETDLDHLLLRKILLWGPLYWLASILVMLANGIRTIVKKNRMPPGTHWHDVPPLEPIWPGPHVPRFVRRAAVVPYTLLGDALVPHLVAFLDTQVRTVGALWATELFIPVMSLLMAYLFFVVGPRVATGSTVSPWVWVGRFATYFLALALFRLREGGWAGLIPG